MMLKFILMSLVLSSVEEPLAEPSPIHRIAPVNTHPALHTRIYTLATKTISIAYVKLDKLTESLAKNIYRNYYKRELHQNDIALQRTRKIVRHLITSFIFQKILHAIPTRIQNMTAFNTGIWGWSLWLIRNMPTLCLMKLTDFNSPLMNLTAYQPMGYVTEYACTDYKTKNYNEQFLYKNAVMANLALKPSGISCMGLFDLFNYASQRYLLMENDMDTVKRGDGNVHHYLAITTFLFTTYDFIHATLVKLFGRWVFTTYGRIACGTLSAQYMLFSLFAFKQKCKDGVPCAHQIWQRYFLWSSLALKIEITKHNLLRDFIPPVMGRSTADFLLQTIVPLLLPALFHVKMMERMQHFYRTPEEFGKLFQRHPKDIPSEIWKIIPSEREIRRAMEIAGFVISQNFVPTSVKLYNASPVKVQQFLDRVYRCANGIQNTLDDAKDDAPHAE